MRREKLAEWLLLALAFAALLVVLVRTEFAVSRIESLLQGVQQPLGSIENKLSGIGRSLGSLEEQLGEIEATTKELDERMQIVDSVNAAVAAISPSLGEAMEELSRWLDRRLAILGLAALIVVLYSNL
ncbi:MAG: hypothetical protein NUW06_04205 [Candidatus Acetothermia bacterium]|jgi:uncharacterized protein YoxC|nr:hypothetical protein [Candidatus Acetothermia bacterium]MDH7505153.1 hypothetical protein [Candidatus Acetothermia bacterium]